MGLLGHGFGVIFSFMFFDVGFGVTNTSTALSSTSNASTEAPISSNQTVSASRPTSINNLISLGVANLTISNSSSTWSSSAKITAKTGKSGALNFTSIASVNNSADACYSQQISYNHASIQYSLNNQYYTTITTVFETSFTTNTRYNCTSHCGSICYAGTASYEAIPYIYTSLPPANSIFLTGSHYPRPSPNCTIPASDCDRMVTSFYSQYDSYYSLPYSERLTVTDVTEPIYPRCTTCTSTTCQIGAESVNLYFWPVTTSFSRDYCAIWPAEAFTGPAHFRNNTYVPTTTGIHAVTDGITMYQGNVYLSFDSKHISATDNCGNEITRHNPGRNMITAASHEVYTYARDFVSGSYTMVYRPITYADFNEPVPFSAYWLARQTPGRPWILPDASLVVFPDSYNPWILLPPQLVDIDDNWRSCGWADLSLDPPIALQSVPEIFPPVSTAIEDPMASSQVPPSPGHTRTRTVPIETSPPNDNQNPPIQRPSNSPQQPPNPNPPDLNPSLQPPSDSQTTAIAVGSLIIPIDPTGGLVISPGATLTQGSPAATISSTTFSIGNGNEGLIIISPSTSTQIAFGNTPITIPMGPGENAPLTLDPSGTVIIPGMTLRNGDPIITIGGTALSLGPSGLFFSGPEGTSMIAIPTQGPTAEAKNSPTTPHAVVTIGSSVFQLENGKVILGAGNELDMGDPAITIDGTIMSLGPSGLVLSGPKGTTTIPIPTSQPTSVDDPSDTSNAITIGSSIFQLKNGKVILGSGIELGIGDPAVTISGIVYTMGPSGVIVAGPKGTFTVPVPTAIHAGGKGVISGALGSESGTASDVPVSSGGVATSSSKDDNETIVETVTVIKETGGATRTSTRSGTGRVTLMERGLASVVVAIVIWVIAIIGLL